MHKGALSGMTVIDLTRVLAGPYCSMLLADMGADVIKVEMPGKGDDSRAHYPQINGESAYYMNLNRGKRSMTLNLKSEEGKNILRELVKKADVILENYRPGVMEKLGLGYEELKKINPGIIYGCVSGFGHYGPYSSRPGYDIIGQAMGGLMSTTGWPGGEPTRSGTLTSAIDFQFHAEISGTIAEKDGGRFVKIILDGVDVLRAAHMPVTVRAIRSVSVVILIGGIIHVQKRSAEGAMDVIALIAAFTQGHCIIAGIVVLPDTFAAVSADEGFFFQTLRAKVLPIKAGSPGDWMLSAADFTGKGFCSHFYFLLEFCNAPMLLTASGNVGIILRGDGM